MEEWRPKRHQSKTASHLFSRQRHLPHPMWFLFIIAIGLIPPNLFAAEIPENAETPIHLSAKRLQYFKKRKIVIAEGGTEVKQGAMHLKADMFRFNQQTRILSAIGDIRFFDGENNIDAKRLTINIDTKLGVIYNGKLFLKKDNYHIEGKEIIRHAPNRYEIKTSSFTACDCQENPAWRIRAGNLDLTTDEYLYAKHARLYVKNVPIFYVPYFVYPAKRERQTGLLVPRIGLSSEYGFRYRQDLFLALADNKDATISLEDRGDKGKGLGLEYRYVLSKKAHGQLNTTYFRDKEDDVDRWEARFNHKQQFSSRVQAKLDLKYVNESSNFQALSDNTAARAQQNIESNLSLTYQGDASFAYFLARYTQDLTKVSNSSTPQRLPEIGYSLIEYHPGDAPFFLNFDSTAVNFWSEGGLNLKRVDLYPKLSLPIPLGAGATLSPWVGFRETWYRHGVLSDEAISRNVIPAGVTLEGEASKKWGQTTQQINTSLFYENIAVTDGNDIIQIDELDALHDRQNITLTLIQRFLKLDRQDRPVEKLSFRLTETYHLDKIAPEALTLQRLSDLRGELHLQPIPPVSLEVDLFYDFHDDRVSSVNTDLGLKIDSYLKFFAGHRSTRDGSVPKKGDLFNPYYLGDQEAVTPQIDFLTGKVKIKTPWGIRLSSAIYYDSDQREVAEVDYGLEYHEQCWNIGFSFLDFPDRDEFTFVITLKGLGGFSPEQ